MTHVERRRATPLQWMRDYAPVGVMGLMGWLLITAVSTQKDIVATQKDIVALRLQVAMVQKDITAHAVDSKDDARKVSETHHSANINPCNGCHTKK